jgi:ribosomal protein L19
MNWNIAHIVEVIVGVVIGGLITLAVNLYLQTRDRKKQYAVWNRDEIYAPLYDEIKSNRIRSLAFFEDPFDATTTLQSWDAFRPSTRLRTPLTTRRLIEDFEKRAREYYEAHSEARKVLDEGINKVFSEIGREMDGDLNIQRQNLWDDYRGDLFAGEIIQSKKRRLPQETVLVIKASSRLTFETIFQMISSSIGQERDIIHLRERREELVKITERLEKHLEEKMHLVMRKFESKVRWI